MDTKRFIVAWFVIAGLLHFGCATSPYLKGVTPDGKKVYLGPTPIENTKAFEAFLHGSRTEAAKLEYLVERLKLAENLQFFHGGEQFEWKEALEGSKWAVAHHYKKGQDARTFIRKETFLYVEPGEPNAVKFPDGTIHLDYYVLANELDLLEETFRNISNSNPKGLLR